MPAAYCVTYNRTSTGWFGWLTIHRVNDECQNIMAWSGFWLTLNLATHKDSSQRPSILRLRCLLVTLNPRPWVCPILVSFSSKALLHRLRCLPSRFQPAGCLCTQYRNLASRPVAACLRIVNENVLISFSTVPTGDRLPQFLYPSSTFSKIFRIIFGVVEKPVESFNSDRHITRNPAFCLIRQPTETPGTGTSIVTSYPASVSKVSKLSQPRVSRYEFDSHIFP